MTVKAEAAKPHFTIWPDYGGAFLWINTAGTDSLQGGEYSSEARNLENSISKSLISRLDSWQSIYEKGAYQSTEHGGRRPFDWQAFHTLGIRLAAELKEELGDNARVFYEKPDEDPNFQLNQRREVLIDGQSVGAER
jgi:hypothetical protein